MPGFIRSNLGAVLPLLRTQLMTFTGFPEERVVVQKHTNQQDPASLQADQVIVITAEGETPVRPQITSAGRRDARMDRRVTVTLWNRLNLDEAYQDYEFLLHTEFGLIPFENSVYNCLLTWVPTDGSNNVLAVPTRVEVITPPQTNRQDWGTESVAVVYQFYRDVGQAQNLFPGAQ